MRSIIPNRTSAGRLAAVLMTATFLAAASGGVAEAQRRGSTSHPQASEGVPFTAVPTPRLQAGHSDQVIARKIDMGVGKSIVVDLPREAKEIFVANPAVANAVVRSARKLFVIGVAPGATSIFALDEDGRQIAALELGVGREPGLLHQMLKAALPAADIKASAIGDSIVLTGSVNTVLEAQQAVDIAKGFLGASAVGTAVIEGKVVNSLSVRGKDQVMLKVTVAEVQRTVLKQLGVNVNATWEVAGTTFGAAINNPFTVGLQDPANTVAAAKQAGTALSKGLDIKALERHGVLRTLAEPTLTAVSGETAKFTAGGEVPVPKSSESAPGNDTLGLRPVNKVTVDYKPYGVQLNFTPVVLSEGRISLSVGTEVTEVDAEQAIKVGGFNVPAFRVRKAFTTIELPSGASLVTAGLIQQSSKQAINGLPGLMNLPVLGALFRSRDYQRQETELMIIVQPFIAKPSRTSGLARPTDDYVDASDPTAIFIGRLNRVYGVAGSAPPQSYRGRIGFIHE
jgi:pilus assembly protein CpaC